MDIRLGKASDAIRLSAILRSVEAEAHPWFPEEKREEQATLLAKVMREGGAPQALVLLVNGHTHGFAFTHPETHHLFWLYIDRRYRSAGLGKQMVDELKGRHLFLTLDVWLRNQRAMAFYRREGFAEMPAGNETGPDQIRMRWTGAPLAITDTALPPKG